MYSLKLCSVQTPTTAQSITQSLQAWNNHGLQLMLETLTPTNKSTSYKAHKLLCMRNSLL